MKVIVKALLIIVCTLIVLPGNAQKKTSFKPKVVYKVDDLIVTQLSESSYLHTSFLQTQDFGKVPCNGLVVTNNQEAIVFDTPTNDTAAGKLIAWIKEKLQCKINAILPTHFHDDCLGGLQAFHDHNIPSYAYYRTVELAKERHFVVPQNSFKDSLFLPVGDKNIVAKFFGEGHTKDNVVGYFPSDNILFGGCLIKERGASKGFLGDANVGTWSGTVEKIKKEYPNVVLVVPGHGQYGGKKLLDYTIKLFKAQ